MPRTQNRAVLMWILAFGAFAVFLVVYGGFVRLTRSGLSIVEWNPVMGAVPPLTQQAWQVEFVKYQATPEYRQINTGMTISQYKQIFLVEWLHRVLARLAGLVFAIPFLVLVVGKAIPTREIGLYVLMGGLFVAQAVMGWLMVSSGLVDRPAVSHYLLTAHLFLALSLIGLALWTALGHLYGFPRLDRRVRWSGRSRAALYGLVLLLIQMAYGGFTAGLKAGHVSNTWPLMLGRWIPQRLFSQVQPALLNVVDAPVTVVFIHRWLAFAVLAAAVVIATQVQSGGSEAQVKMALVLVLVLGLTQITLGIATVISRVEIGLALLHQFNALCLFGTTVYVLHRLRAHDEAVAA